MFDITGEDIDQLGDADFRTLVARLALAELAHQGAPLSAVTAGGRQDAKDGGIDVRVNLTSLHASPDFVPRAKTGFQVKKPDMPPNKITLEMRPKGKLREAISELSDAGGAYVVVSAKATVADTALSNRISVMRSAISDHPNADNLFIDFYDRERLTNWVNQYPGVAVWVRAKAGGALSGWRPVGRWHDTETAEDAGYLASDEINLLEESSQGRRTLTIADGIERLRATLSNPRSCIRLIGMSGVGKTRLVQALFEQGVGEAPLDPALSVYTDYTEGTAPSGQEMARRLVDSGTRAILIIDNCNPANHGQLASICSEAVSQVSLLTVEYDVRDDEPEHTEVFRLTRSSDDLIEEWLAREFPHISHVDRKRITEFSDGNFRVARALAETLRRGETLGQLKSQDLFERIFVQRNVPDQSLLHDAEVLALLYSFDGENIEEGGELSHLSFLINGTPSKLFGSSAELLSRGVIQSRGRWRAVLPQAIANPLAAKGLQRIPPPKIDAFSRAITPRMLRSFSRRLGYLHNSQEAHSLVERWLQSDGPLGDLIAREEFGLSVIRNIAPVAPKEILDKISTELDKPDSPSILATSNRQRTEWIYLLRSLAYEPKMFDRAANLLARFVAVEPQDYNYDPASSQFSELFHIVLSGTRAKPEQRRNLARAMLESEDAGLRRCGVLALDGLLKTSHFTSFMNFEFGARPRDFGWEPESTEDVRQWFNAVIELAVPLAEEHKEVKRIVARHVRGLWASETCYDALEDVSTRFLETGEWIDGWLAFRSTLRFDGDGMTEAVRYRLLEIIDRLKPANLTHRARAFVLSGSAGDHDVVDGEEDEEPMDAWQRAARMAVSIGQEFATNADLLRQFLPEVVNQSPAHRAYEFGCGLAQGATDLQSTWDDIVIALKAAPERNRNPTVAGGYLDEAYKRDTEFANAMLDAIARDDELVPNLPYLQSRASVDSRGLQRLENAAEGGLVDVQRFRVLATGVISGAPEKPFISLLNAIASSGYGVGVALDILHMRLFCAKADGVSISRQLIVCGRELLRNTDFTKTETIQDFELGRIVELCLASSDATEDARIICGNLRIALETSRMSSHDASRLLTALFKTQPDISLDSFLLDGPPRRNRHLFEFGFGEASPLEGLDAETLCGWADKDPQQRYPLLGNSLSLGNMSRGEQTDELSQLFVSVMEKAPDKGRFLRSRRNRLGPSTWSGSLADILERRKSLFLELATHDDADVRAWSQEQLESLDTWIAAERQREAKREESFE